MVSYYFLDDPLVITAKSLGDISEGMAEMPEESNIDTESDGAGLGEYEDFSDGDHEKDEDYIDTQAPNQSDHESSVEEQDEEEIEVLETAPSRKQKRKVILSSSFIITVMNDSHFVSGNPTWNFSPRYNFCS